MNDVLTWLGAGYQAYRAFQDSGGWIFQSEETGRMAYVEAWLIRKGIIS